MVSAAQDDETPNGIPCPNDSPSGTKSKSGDTSDLTDSFISCREHPLPEDELKFKTELDGEHPSVELGDVVLSGAQEDKIASSRPMKTEKRRSSIREYILAKSGRSSHIEKSQNANPGDETLPQITNSLNQRSLEASTSMAMPPVPRP